MSLGQAKRLSDVDEFADDRTSSLSIWVARWRSTGANKRALSLTCVKAALAALGQRIVIYAVRL